VRAQTSNFPEGLKRHETALELSQFRDRNWLTVASVQALCGATEEGTTGLAPLNAPHIGSWEDDMATSAKTQRYIARSMEGLSHLDRIEAVVGSEGLTSVVEEVSDSWRRCTGKYRIDPNTRTAPYIITESEIKASREPVDDIIVAAQEEIDRLYAIVRQEGYVVLFCNTDGIAIHHRGDEGKAEQFKHWGIWEGGVWSEEIEGTNGIGTCIAEQRPVSVHRGQHFRTRHIELSCAGAPIFDASGALVAVLDTSSMTSARSDRSHGLALAATIASARAIEERLFRQRFAHTWNIAAVPLDDSVPASLLAVDSDQRVVGADRVARLAFAFSDKSLTNGVHLSRVFEYEPALFRRSDRQDVPARLMRAGGDRWWHVLITPPLSRRREWRSLAETIIQSQPRISRLGNLPIPKPSTASRAGLPPALTHRICEHIDSHLEEKLSLDELAAMAGFSVHHFARAFAQSVGVPPHSYLLQRRIEKAQHMLRDTELPLSEIALAVGFFDQSHLARHFRRLAGAPPSIARWKER
jgi:AraC-like DNA-binding protein